MSGSKISVVKKWIDLGNNTFFDFLKLKPPSPSGLKFCIRNLTQNKMNLLVLSGHVSESFAAFFNGVILQKNNAAVITTAVITTHHESKLRFK